MTRFLMWGFGMGCAAPDGAVEPEAAAVAARMDLLQPAVDDGDAWVLEAIPTGSDLGHSVASAGDVNGDGFDDLLVGAPDDAFSRGAAFVFHGAEGGLRDTPAWHVTHQEENNTLLGRWVSPAGDVNGDGYGDVAVGEVDTVFVYHGSPAGLASFPSWKKTDSGFGSQFASAGDVNGDGYDDLVIGDRSANDDGSAYVFHGSASGLSTQLDWEATGNSSVGTFGISVASAGDVNGDGFDDVAVSALVYLAPDGVSSEGAAVVYLGSPRGLAPSPAWYRNHPGPETGTFGDSVAGAGDVNGDGFADLLVSAPSSDGLDFGANGAVFLYFGSDGGLGSAEWYANSGFQDINNSFATSHASAGDINGDGFDDLIVGNRDYPASGLIRSGAASFYLGGADGPRRGGHKSNAVREGATEVGQFGTSVASAGDLNGDGYADTVVGEPVEDGPGRVWVFYGGIFERP